MWTKSVTSLCTIFKYSTRQNLFDESSQPKTKEKGDSQPYISNIQCIYDKFASICLKDDNALDLEKTWYLALRLAKMR